MSNTTAQPASGTETAQSVDEQVKKLEKELADKQRSIDGLAAERNQYRQKANTWEQFGQQHGEVLEYDANGNPVGLKMQQNAQNGSQYAGYSPFDQAGMDGQQVNGYIQQLLQTQGYVTNQQMQQAVTQAAQNAYSAARGDFMVLRKIDRLTSNEKYKDLSAYDSELSKRTAKLLQDRQLGQPLNDAVGWDQWRYRDLDSLQYAADQARLSLWEEGQAAQVSQAEAQNNQQNAQFSVSSPGLANPGSSAPDFSTMTSEEIDDQLAKDVEANAIKAGYIKT